MNWVTYNQMQNDVEQFCRQLPPLNGVVGIPRSGMLVALHIGFHLNLPVTDVKSYRRGIWGQTKKKPILLVDDSVATGRTMQEAQKGLHNIITGTLYNNNKKITHYWKNLTRPRIFEWNLFRSNQLHNAMMDIDGVICYDPPVYDDDGPVYQKALKQAIPFHLPKTRTRYIISGRIERWRTPTEQWLKEQSVIYEKLILHPAKTADIRRKQGNPGIWKGKTYKKSKAILFIESSKKQSPVIAEVSGKPVICMEDKCLYKGNRYIKTIFQVKWHF